MRVPLSWLREYVDVDLGPEALAERLTLLGMEVKGIDRIGADWSSIVVGELLEVVPHPTARKLSLTRVHVGDGEPELSIVCGATNIAPGQRVPVALPGALLPGGRRIDVTRIAGEESQGMLCSGDELGLTADAEGILILDGGRLGEPLQAMFGDEVLDVDVKPNRGDALSVVGLAREVAAALGTRVRVPSIDVPGSGDEVSAHVAVEVRDPLRCPRFVARYIDGITVGPSPVAVQVRLTAAGIRPISNVVDASNYVMLELGKPTHTFDAECIADGRIVVRAAEPGERLETLDHVQRDLTPDTLLIADARGPVGIAGVMGGADSEVHEDTTAVIVESAIFDPISIRRTGQRYGLRSEASLRFEKGQEWRLARVGADRATELILRWAGGRAAVGVVDTDPIDPPPVRVPFRPERVSRLLGVPIHRDEVQQLLQRVEVATEEAGAGDAVTVADGERPVTLDDATEALVAVIPSHRRDLRIEADITEEVARIRGYETLPGRRPDTLMPSYRPDPTLAVDGLRELLSGRGLNEVVTHGLIAPLDHARLGLTVDDPETIRAANPVTVDHSELRRSLVPELVRVLVDNERQRREDLAIFEIGPIHAFEDGRPVERRRLGILLSGATAPPHPDGASRDADVADAKGLVEWLVSRVGSGNVRYEPATAMEGVEHPGRTATVIGEPLAADVRIELGRVGELDPRYLGTVGARTMRAAVAIIDLDALALLRPDERAVLAVERLPGIDRDLSVVVGESTPAGEVAAVIRAAGGPRLRSVRLFDRYRGAPLADDEVNLGFRLRFEPGDHPLDEAALELIVATILEGLAARLGARPRA